MGGQDSNTSALLDVTALHSDTWTARTSGEYWRWGEGSGRGRVNCDLVRETVLVHVDVTWFSGGFVSRSTCFFLHVAHQKQQGCQISESLNDKIRKENRQIWPGVQSRD